MFGCVYIVIVDVCCVWTCMFVLCLMCVCVCAVYSVHIVLCVCVFVTRCVNLNCVLLECCMCFACVRCVSVKCVLCSICASLHVDSRLCQIFDYLLVFLDVPQAAAEGLANTIPDLLDHIKFERMTAQQLSDNVVAVGAVDADKLKLGKGKNRCILAQHAYTHNTCNTIHN